MSKTKSNSTLNYKIIEIQGYIFRVYCRINTDFIIDNVLISHIKSLIKEWEIGDTKQLTGTIFVTLVDYLGTK